jgi:hypothetical protein
VCKVAEPKRGREEMEIINIPVCLSCFLTTTLKCLLLSKPDHKLKVRKTR